MSQVFDPIVMKSGDHSEYCKCLECSGNNLKRVRCSSFAPGCIQCRLEMYHLGLHQYEPFMPFSTHLPEEVQS